MNELTRRRALLREITVQPENCYDPADYTLVHNKYLDELRGPGSHSQLVLDAATKPLHVEIEKQKAGLAEAFGAAVHHQRDAEQLRKALSAARTAMLDCQRNAHKGHVCFDGDDWHERMKQIDDALAGYHPPQEGQQ